jgi:hypothetical protein
LISSSPTVYLDGACNNDVFKIADGDADGGFQAGTLKFRDYPKHNCYFSLRADAGTSATVALYINIR